MRIYLKFCGLILLFFHFFTLVQGQELRAYALYDKEGRKVEFGKMIDDLAKAEVILFGEHHNNSINHWLQLQTAKALYEKRGKKLILAAEMFERDNQQALDAYLKGDLTVKELEEQARLWPNFTTDYQPLLDFAKEKELKFIAANIPRRYASLVARNGQDTLRQFPREEQRWMAKMPIAVDTLTPGYAEMIDMMGDHMPGNPINFVAAQAVKDATMAESIKKAGSRRHLLLHFNGDYHSKAYGGIYWYLKRLKKRWKVAVISVEEGQTPELALPEDHVLTDYNLVFPEDMTKTY